MTIEEKVSEIIKRDIIIHGDECYCNFCILGGEVDQASKAILELINGKEA